MYGFLRGPYFLVLGLNMEIYRVNLRIYDKYGEIQTRKKLFIFSFITFLLYQYQKSSKSNIFTYNPSKALLKYIHIPR